MNFNHEISMLYLTRSSFALLPGRIALLTAGCLIGLVGKAAAQEFEVGPGLVVEIEMTSTAPDVGESTRQGINRALAGILRLIPQDNVSDWNEAMENLGPPETVTQDITVYIKGARIRVDIGRNSLLGRLAPDGTVSEWAILDPGSGRVMDSDFFDRAVRARSAAEYEAFGGDAEVIPVDVQTGGFRDIQGHRARQYTFTRRAILATAMTEQDGTPLGATVTSTVEAWVATEGPYTQDAGIVQFFRVFGDELDLAPPESEEGLPAGAVILESHEKAQISIGGVSGGGESLAEASSTTVIKDISRRDLDDELFAGFDREEKGCDCSCEAFKELQAISELPKQQQQNHPKAMSLAMCARECGGAWASFPKSVYEGGECPVDN